MAQMVGKSGRVIAADRQASAVQLSSCRPPGLSIRYNQLGTQTIMIMLFFKFLWRGIIASNLSFYLPWSFIYSGYI